VFAHGVTAYILWVGFLMSAVSLFSQAWAIYHGWEHWQTIVFTVLCLSQMGNVLAVRSERESLFSLGLLSNRPLLVSVLLTLLLQMATIYVPFLQPVFHTAPLSAGELLFCLALSALVLIAVELQKALRRRLS
jgi:Ca2+-transporting ATPase